VLAGLELGNIWYIADLMNIVVVYFNVPIILIGGHMVFKSLRHYDKTGGSEGFASLNDAGFATPYWSDENKKARAEVTVS
jgi:AGCS family alanine or glycine:cation symporter